MRERLKMSTESREWAMYNELLNQLEKRIQEAVETIEMYRLEIAELKEKNSELEKIREFFPLTKPSITCSLLYVTFF